MKYILQYCCVKEMFSLGHQLSNHRKDGSIQGLQGDSQKVNSFLGDFDHLSFIVKNYLFGKNTA